MSKNFRAILGLLMRKIVHTVIQRSSTHEADNLAVMALRAELYDVLEILVTHQDVDLSAKDPAIDYSPFWYAIVRKRRRGVEILLNNAGTDRLDPNERDENGHTPLIISIKQGSHDIAVLLLQDERIDVNAPDTSGYTAAHHVVICEAYDGGEELDKRGRSIIKATADRTSKGSNRGNNAPHAVPQKKKPPDYQRLLRLLFKRSDVNSNAQDLNGLTPLHIAASRGLTNSCWLLVSNQHVDVNMKNQSGETPLVMAVNAGHLAIIDLLLQCSDLKVDSAHADAKAFRSLVEYVLTADQRPLPAIIDKIRLRLEIEKKQAELQAQSLSIDLRRRSLSHLKHSTSRLTQTPQSLGHQELP